MSSIITIDNKDYEIDKLSQEAKSQIEMIINTDTKINELNRDLAICMTARNAYSQILNNLLENK